jgi:hypothetical protein
MRGRSPDSGGGRWFGGRGRVAHATVVAYLALFVALAGGSAFAASRYLITSPKQIKPSVRRALHGRRGVRGPTGPTGAAGTPGGLGATGPTGAIGLVLPAGESETGVFFAEGTASTSAELASASISFPVALASAPTASIVTSGSSSNCPGTVSAPAAARGYLCVYVGVSTNVGVQDVYDPFGGVGGTTSRYGAGFVADSAGPGNFYTDGTWAVTAP